MNENTTKMASYVNLLTDMTKHQPDPKKNCSGMEFKLRLKLALFPSDLNFKKTALLGILWSWAWCGWSRQLLEPHLLIITLTIISHGKQSVPSSLQLRGGSFVETGKEFTSERGAFFPSNQDIFVYRVR